MDSIHKPMAVHFDHMSSTQFEEFCFDLLSSLGFVNIDWRKGTPKDASPSDSGRDIEASLLKREPDGGEYHETWFVDAKHYTSKGVPPADLAGTLAWADAEKPDVVLFIASGYLSNGAKDNLAKQAEFKPYRIRYWENIKLEEILVGGGRTRLMLRHKVIDQSKLTDMLHPAHLRYITTPTLNSLSYFIKILEKSAPKLRKDVLHHAFIAVLGFDSRPPKHLNESLGELVTEPFTMDNFVQRCQLLTDALVCESALIETIVSSQLRYSFDSANVSKRDEVEANLRGLLSGLDDSAPIQIRETIEARIQNLELRYEEAYEEYIAFCNAVVSPLLEEPLPSINLPYKTELDDLRADAEDVSD